jgi:CHAD domain-containing protein
LHRIRIKSKQLRYAAEAATPVIGKPAQRTAAAAERVQTVLGEHHDAVAAVGWLRDEWTSDSTTRGSSAVSPTVSFEVGRLVAESSRRQRKAGRHWVSAWNKLRSKKRRSWLSRH